MQRKRMVGRLATVAAICVSGSEWLSAEEYQVTDTWVMEITPAARAVTEIPCQTPAPPVPGDESKAIPTMPAPAATVDPREYARIYRTIPFNRAEYDANPSYRHDSTMEILTGHARHQTIVRHSTERPRPVVNTAPYTIPYRYNNADLGLNYQFYFPYWNARGFY